MAVMLLLDLASEKPGLDALTVKSALSDACLSVAVAHPSASVVPSAATSWAPEAVHSTVAPSTGRPP
jgi:hypothetical protein